MGVRFGAATLCTVFGSRTRRNRRSLFYLRDTFVQRLVAKARYASSRAAVDYGERAVGGDSSHCCGVSGITEESGINRIPEEEPSRSAPEARRSCACTPGRSRSLARIFLR